MCNRYGHWATLFALRARAKQMQLEFFTSGEMGNLLTQENIYPDQDAPILINHDGGLQLRQGRWGLPSLPHAKEPVFREKDDKDRWQSPRCNIRKVDHWATRASDIMLEPSNRCLVPFSAFAEPVRDSTWFSAVDEEVAFFAGICMEWSGYRLKAQPGKARRAREQDDWLLYAFLTTEANELVATVHPDAMPVILTEADECNAWLSGGEESLSLQRPLAEGVLAKVNLS